MSPREGKHQLWARIRDIVVGARDFGARGLWSLHLTKLTRLQAFTIRQVKVLFFLVRQFYADKLLIHASALTYSSLLAIVPFLAVVFSIFKGLGLHTDLAPILSSLLRPLGPRGDQISTQVLEFVGNSQTGALGGVGFAVLLITVYGILSKIEVSYNDIWHVPRIRTWPRRLVAYMLLTVVGPLLMLLILGLTAYVTSMGIVQETISHKAFAAVLEVVLKLVPYVLSCLLFALTIWFVPNMHVRFKAAVAGGVFSGILWQLSNWGFARFVSGTSRATPQEVLFAGFAALPLFLLWMYVSWVIMLLGAELGYVLQHVGVMEWRKLEKRYGDTLRCFVGIRVVLRIVQQLTLGKKVSSLDELATEAHVPEPIIRDVLESLVAARILARCTNGVDSYIPAQDPAMITMAELVLILRGHRELRDEVYSRDPFGQNVEGLLRKIDASMGEGTGKLSLLEAAQVVGGIHSHDEPMLEK